MTAWDSESMVNTFRFSKMIKLHHNIFNFCLHRMKIITEYPDVCCLKSHENHGGRSALQCCPLYHANETETNVGNIKENRIGIKKLEICYMGKFPKKMAIIIQRFF